jgi:hypothetical protein
MRAFTVCTHIAFLAVLLLGCGTPGRPARHLQRSSVAP